VCALPGFIVDFVATERVCAATDSRVATDSTVATDLLVANDDSLVLNDSLQALRLLETLTQKNDHGVVVDFDTRDFFNNENLSPSNKDDAPFNEPFTPAAATAAAAAAAAASVASGADGVGVADGIWQHSG
jgi:hypothetical protein